MREKAITGSASLRSIRNASYPAGAAERDRWILALRGVREAVDPSRPVAFFVEDERAESGEIISVATIFLTNRECPWRCLMCDLWRHTLTETVPAGAIAAQIAYALERLPAARQIKLYNSGSFFDPGAIPTRDLPAIARLLRGFDRVIVESHPSLIKPHALAFREQIDGTLEVAIGLETAHPEILARLNKRMTLEQFAQAAALLREHGVALRTFILVKPPFLDEAGALYWAQRSLDFAADSGATASTLIPTRPGNGALEILEASGEFSPPHLATLEAALAYGITQKRGRVFADLWDLARFSKCPACFPGREARLREMNLHQLVPEPIGCECCGL